ncbi:MAG: right-handed parallel beta-helix repeat-containing protein, partial [Deltaproteobacteria bacterium]|nr:right-handed parallel beta-helix repeat-containing protein [Deltaproteobacteria bacterium]
MTPILLTLALSALSADYYVATDPSDCGQAAALADTASAFAAAQSGDTIWVGPGVWPTASIVLSQSGLTVTSCDPSDPAVLEGPAFGHLLTVDHDLEITLDTLVLTTPARAIFMMSGASLVMRDVDVTGLGSPTLYQGRAVSVGGADLTVEGGVWRDLVLTTAGQSNYVYGGAIAATSGAHVSLTDLTLEGAAALQGGAIYLSGTSALPSTLEADGLVIRDARSTHNTQLLSPDGGAIALMGVVSAAIRNSTFEDNHAAGMGGAIAMNGSGTLSLSDCTFDGNSATDSGGQLAVLGSTATLSLEGGALLNGETGQVGAGLYLTKAGLTITGTRFEGNRLIGSMERGGALHLDQPAGTAILEDLRLVDNQAPYGAAIYYMGDHTATSGGLRVRDSVFQGNSGVSDPALSVLNAWELEVARNRVCDNRGDAVAYLTLTGGTTAVTNNLYLRNEGPLHLWNVGHGSAALNYNAFLAQDGDALVLDTWQYNLRGALFAWSLGQGLVLQDAVASDLSWSGESVWIDDGPYVPYGRYPPDDDPLIYQDPETMPCDWYTVLEGGPLVGTLDPLTYGWHDLNLDSTWPHAGVSGGPSAPPRLWEDRDGDEIPMIYDCDDADASISPAQPELWYDGIDQRCDHGSDWDQDGDGVDLGEDCDDEDPLARPGATERCNLRDDNCDGQTDEDDACACAPLGDFAGHPYTLCAGPLPWDQAQLTCAARGQHLVVITDADEDAWLTSWVGDNVETWIGYSDATAEGDWRWVSAPGGAFEGWSDSEPNNSDDSEDCAALWQDGTWNDLACARALAFLCEAPCQDDDGDGHLAALCGGDDCDDGEITRSPGADEVPYNGVDEDCDGADLTDVDGDLFDGGPWGDDCDDDNPEVHPGAVELPNNGLDDDCSGGDLTDADGDGYLGGESGPDCDDTDPGAHPGAPEVWYDGVDQDCDGASDFDQDRDGADRDADCDDTDPSRHPDATDIAYNGVDEDCSGMDLTDVDGDTYHGGALGTDCDDTRP